MSGLMPSARARTIAAQASGLTMIQAIELLKRANRYVGTSNSTRAMDLSVEITEFVAAYQQAQNVFACENSDSGQQTNPLEPAI